MAALFILAPMSAHALFEDSDARREIIRLRKQLEELNTRVETKAETKAVIDVSTDIDKLRADVAALRGQIEVLANDLANAQRRQKDLYNDLDERMRKLEPRQLSIDGKDAEVSVAEQKAYEAAMAQFKASNFNAASQALSAFMQRYPDSAYLPQAYFWLGSSYFSLQDCTHAMPAYQTVASRFPSSQRAPDALLNIASCQLDLKDKAAARETLDSLIKKYPAAAASTTARERITEIK